jgi:hypothetical protein
MANHVVRKGSIYRTGVVLRTKTNIYFYRMWCGISYYHTSKTTMPNQTTMPYQTPSPFQSWHHFSMKSTEIVSFHTDTKSSGMDTVLNKHSISLFRRPTEHTSSIFLWQTAPQTTHYSNLDHIIFLHHCGNLKVAHFKI